MIRAAVDRAADEGAAAETTPTRTTGDTVDSNGANAGLERQPQGRLTPPSVTSGF